MSSSYEQASTDQLQRPYTDWAAQFLPNGISPHSAVIKAALFGDPGSLLSLSRAATSIYMTAPELAASILAEPISTEPEEPAESVVPTDEPASTWETYTDADGQEYFAYGSPDQIDQLG